MNNRILKLTIKNYSRLEHTLLKENTTLEHTILKENTVERKINRENYSTSN